MRQDAWHRDAWRRGAGPHPKVSGEPAGHLETNTNIATSVAFPPDMDPDLARRMGGLRGMAEPEEVAALFAFLASDDARSVTGSVYTLDNGLTAS